jgi:hypothetical protein
MASSEKSSRMAPSPMESYRKTLQEKQNLVLVNDNAKTHLRTELSPPLHDLLLLVELKVRISTEIFLRV